MQIEKVVDRIVVHKHTFPSSDYKVTEDLKDVFMFIDLKDY